MVSDSGEEPLRARPSPHHATRVDSLSLPRHPRLHEFVASVGTGFLYGTFFGSVLAVVDGYRESPQHQRLRGIVHHGKHVIPATAGRIAIVTGLFRVASYALDTARGHDHADLLTVLLAAPLAGAMLRFRQGPRAAAHAALTFGSVSAVMVLFNVAQAKVGRRHRDPPDEVLEEVAFAEGIEEFEMDTSME
jgi:hypothetical protein